MTEAIEPTIDTKPAKTGKKGGFFRYLLLPDIIPQARELGRGGFGFLAFLIAYVYQGVRILPANHPYANINNFGSFGIRDVIVEAANHVKLDRKHLDQVVIFFAILVGLALMALQFLAFLVMLFSGEAFAGPGAPPEGLFTTEFPETDIAFFMLREVFGIPDFFGPLTNDPNPVNNGISAFHTALHGLFAFYNLAILVVAILVFLYYVIVVVNETAQTGTPFGQRFSHIYAPLRLVIAIGLLVPLNYGFNAAQWITFYSAKLGSGFASTGWIQFNDSLAATNPLGAENATLISPTKTPDIEGLVEFMAVVHGCRAAYFQFGRREIVGRIVQILDDGNTELLEFSYGGFVTLANALYNRDIKIQFGYFIQTSDGAAQGNEPVFNNVCGEVTVPITVPLQGTYNGSLGVGGLTANLSPVQSGDVGYLQEAYYRVVQYLWIEPTLIEMANNTAAIYDSTARAQTYPLTPHPPLEEQEAINSAQRIQLEGIVRQHYENAATQSDFSFNEEIRIRGWGGAGIWYNRIAEINGGYTVATMNVPMGSAFPAIMEHVADQKRAADSNFDSCEAFDPNIADNEDMEFEDRVNGLNHAQIMNEVYKYWVCDNAKKPNNFILDTISAIFGLDGLMSIRDTVEVATPEGPQEFEIHPLAKLSALGKGLIESAVRNLAMSFTASVFGGAFNILAPQIGAGLMAASSMFSSIAVIGLSIGFITYYILPFLPFIYFFFAVGGWVKGIFEAMVGAPLWALAHLRIDGDGIPGKMALNGYFLIFEIFLRPILTVFGLLGGMAIFSASAAILNEIFDLVVLNTANINLEEREGFGRGIIDVFFFTVVYAIILYMMAMASFKMITLVPNSIIRWLGQSVQSFNDGAPDPAGNLTSYAAIGGNQIGGQVIGGFNKAGEALGSAGGSLVRFGLGSGPPRGTP